MNKGSKYIPDGLLPRRKDDPIKYAMEYTRLRKIYDPEFRKQVKAKDDRARAKYILKQVRKECG